MTARRGLTLVEVLVGTGMLVTLTAVLVAGSSALGRQSKAAFSAASQVQDALLLLETMRADMAGIVMNPLPDAEAHEGNSILVSQPNRTSIQFVTDRMEGDRTARSLVYYEATEAGAGRGPARLSLRRTVWRFERTEPWTRPIAFPPGWPADWIGPVAAHDEARFRDLDLVQLRWDYLIPSEQEGRAFLRVKMVVRAGSRLLPFSTLVPLRLPEAGTAISFSRTGDRNVGA